MNIKTAKLLKANGYNNVFVVDPPDSVDSYILVSSSGGRGIDSTDAGYSRPGIQIIVANKSYTQMKADVDSIKKLLYTIDNDKIFNDIAEQDIRGYDISSDMLELGKDEQLRHVNSINFEVHYNIT